MFGIGILITGGNFKEGDTQHTDFHKGFTVIAFTKIFGEDFGAGQGHCDTLTFLMIFLDMS